MKIIINNLKKIYGKKCALDSVNLQIEDGMFGLLGANGAGKTTLMRILATVLQKTSGEVIMDGIPIENVTEIRKFIGYLPQEFSFYPNFTVYEILDYFSELSEVKKENLRELLDTVNLLDVQKMKVRTLSGGMKRRLGIAVALINNPKLLFVDEPTVGLDPEERMKFRNLLTKYADNRTIVLSTHIISDIEEICSNLAVMKKGKVLYSGSAKSFRSKTDGKVWELDMSEEQFKDIQNDFEKRVTIVSRITNENRIKLRVISDELPAVEAILVEPRIEDSYIRIMNGF
ncbi:ABC transporter ATP-binding protein [Anaerocolumna sp. AGMB13025]|uniref:ABC transporter ATP-binding protein n=1 Tax=Anaerocolumna sp. AGMB13025 TaxID=3039116 RepID=UPI00241E3F1F|nr:ABC transporter ATP-binding protein [Anaerocolumna sp. AGMB13025]WFR58476.1 ABC transporter ATP-binding protein [Anaerocolumna sp. AGMB13025]